MRRLIFPVLLVTLLLPLSSRAQTVPEDAPSLMPLLLAGEVDAITDGVASGAWNDSNEGLLARALVDDDGLSAVDQMRRFATDKSISSELKTVAWFHLYGYWRLVDNRSEINNALAQVRTNPQLANTLFRGTIPAPMALTKAPAPSSSDSHTVQIGAFGSKVNAQRLADRQTKRGFTVDVVPIKSGGKTLYAVWVGRFDSSRDAASFGSKYYGTEGKDFRVVNR